MLRMAPRYVLYPSYLEMFLALREGMCDVAITAIELDHTRVACDASCPAVPPGGFNWTGLDYEDGWSPELWAASCCIEYGVPYLYSGFALASRVRYRSISILEQLASPTLLNVALVIITMILAMGWCMYGLEQHTNADLASPARGVWWSITTLSTVGFGDAVPITGCGRLVAMAWMLASLLSIAIFTSVLSAKVTASNLDRHVIDTLGHVTRTLCVESAYPTLADYVDLNPEAPPAVVYEPLPVCFEMLLSGAAEAVLTDRPVLTWFVDHYNLGALYVSPVLEGNPFSFAYRPGEALRVTANVAVTQTLKDPTWIPRTVTLAQYYFGSGVQRSAAVFDRDQETTDMRFVVAAAVLAAITCLCTGRPRTLLWAALQRHAPGVYALLRRAGVRHRVPSIYAFRRSDDACDSDRDDAPASSDKRVRGLLRMAHDGGEAASPARSDVADSDAVERRHSPPAASRAQDGDDSAAAV